MREQAIESDKEKGGRKQSSGRSLGCWYEKRQWYERVESQRIEKQSWDGVGEVGIPRRCPPTRGITLYCVEVKACEFWPDELLVEVRVYGDGSGEGDSGADETSWYDNLE